MNWQFYIDIILKLIVTVALLLVYVKVSGKGQLAPATTFDQIGNMVVGAIGGSTLLNHDVSILDSAVFMSIWILILLFLRFLRARSSFVKEFIDGRRELLMDEGRLEVANFKRLNITPSSVETSMHAAGLTGINQVKNIWVESNGQITFDKKGETEMSILLIEDGLISQEGLETLDKDEEWLSERLCEKGATDVKDVFFAEWVRDSLWLYGYDDDRIEQEKSPR